jgi:hypothetical protein
MSKQHVTRVFEVSQSSMQRYVRLAREQADLTPKPLPGRQPLIGPEAYPALTAQLETQPPTQAAISPEMARITVSGMRTRAAPMLTSTALLRSAEIKSSHSGSVIPRRYPSRCR